VRGVQWPERMFSVFFGIKMASSTSSDSSCNYVALGVSRYSPIFWILNALNRYATAFGVYQGYTLVTFPENMTVDLPPQTFTHGTT
jgi:hypothetical protein